MVINDITHCSTMADDGSQDGASASSTPTLTSIQESISDLKTLLAPVLALDAKLDAVRKEMERTSAKNVKLFGLLQTKCDTLVRQMLAVEEGQKKTHKMLQELTKAAAKAEKSAAESAAPVKSAEDRLKAASSLSATISQAMRNEEVEARRSEEEEPVTSDPSGSLSSMNYFARQMDGDRWANNLLLVGDDHWQSLKTTEDVGAELKRMEEAEKDLNFRVQARPGCLVGDLFDRDRGRMLVAVPARVAKVAISVGTKDLLDDSLSTLQKASLEEVRKANQPPLLRKAEALRDMVAYLLDQKKTVVLLLPPIGEQRVEVAHHWCELVLEATASLSASPAFRVINLPEVMMRTMTDFKTHEDFLRRWLADATEGPRRFLSAYGTRRLFDLLKRAVIARKFDPDFSNPLEEVVMCYRCLRQHPGGEAACSSRNKVCRRCGAVGHIQAVHDVTEIAIKMGVTELLGEEIFQMTKPNSKSIPFNGSNGFAPAQHKTTQEGQAPGSQEPARTVKFQGKKKKRPAKNKAAGAIDHNAPWAKNAKMSDWYA